MANHKAIVVIDGCESPFLDALRIMDPKIRNMMLRLEWASEQAFVDFYVESHDRKYGQPFFVAADLYNQNQ